MLHVKDQMCGDLLVALWDFLFVELSLIYKGQVFVKLIHLCVMGFMPSMVFVFFVEADCFIPIAGCAKSVLVSRRRSERP